MSDGSKRVLGALAVVVLVLVGGYLWVRGSAEERLDECEAAFLDWVSAPNGTPQPPVMNEDWCAEHLMDTAGLREPYDP